MLDRMLDIRNDIGWQRPCWKPRELAALLRLTVLQMTVPAASSEKERHSFVSAAPMDDVAHSKIVGLNLKACLFVSLPGHGGSRRLATVNVAGDNAVVSIFIPCVLTAEQKDLVVLEQKKVSFRNKRETWHTKTVKKVIS